MATRQDTSARKRALERHLREICEARANTGGALPPLRELCQQFDLSLTAAHGILQNLQREGLILSNRGSGSTVVPRLFKRDELFVRLLQDSPNPAEPEPPDYSSSGFSGRIAELGAFVVELPSLEHLLRMQSSHPDLCQGMYAASWDPIRQCRRLPELPFPVVGFDEHADPTTDDRVTFDDVHGGRTATEHLLTLGHQSIVFVGESSIRDSWSANRAHGYREALRDAGRASDIRVIPWSEDLRSVGALRAFGEQAAVSLLNSGLPEAVITADDDIAHGFLRALHRQQVPLTQWPAVVGFDDTLVFGGQSISSMRLDYRDAGRAIADLLWERAHGVLTGPPVVRRVPMQLIGRLTSQPGWAYRLNRLLGGYPLDGTLDPE